MALRGPGAGGFTPANSLAASNPCLNCGTNIQLMYCPECGQAEIDSDPTLRELLHELAEEFLHWDGKLATTFRLLLTRPGALTREYLAGRRVRYVSPLRVYLTCSLLYFFVSAVIPSPSSLARREGVGVQTRVGALTIGETDSTATLARLDTLAQHGRWVGQVWGKHFGNAMRHRGELSARLASSIPKTMFVLVPLFAALVMFVFRSSRRRFPQHLTFALHVHAFLFFALTVMLAQRLAGAFPVRLIIQLAGFGAIGAYLVMATRAVYGVSTGAAVGRSALVASIYLPLFLASLVLTFGLIVLFKF